MIVVTRIIGMMSQQQEKIQGNNNYLFLYHQIWLNYDTEGREGNQFIFNDMHILRKSWHDQSYVILIALHSLNQNIQQIA